MLQESIAQTFFENYHELGQLVQGLIHEQHAVVGSPEEASTCVLGQERMGYRISTGSLWTGTHRICQNPAWDTHIWNAKFLATLWSFSDLHLHLMQTCWTVGVTLIKACWGMRGCGGGVVFQGIDRGVEKCFEFLRIKFQSQTKLIYCNNTKINN